MNSFELVNIESLIASPNLLSILPDNIYWKDTRGRYLGSNTEMLNILGYSTSSELIGKNDVQVLGERFGEKIVENDQAVLSARKEITFSENIFDIYDRPAVYLSKKCPLYDSNKQLIGLIGISFDVTEKTKRRESEWFIDDVDDYILCCNENMPKLSPRQEQCLKYMLHGFSAKNIAMKLKLSPRTVEHHIECIKTKFNCPKKSDLLNKILSHLPSVIR